MAKVKVYAIRGWDHVNGGGVMPPTKYRLETIELMSKGLEKPLEPSPESEEIVDDAFVDAEGRHFPTKWS